MNPYQPTIPTGRVPLRQDYLNVQNNFNQINTQFNVDHVPLTSVSGSPPNGFHVPIHMVPFSTTVTNPPDNYPPVAPDTPPQFVANFGQLFSAQVNDGNNTDTALFFLTGKNPSPRLLQLTSNFTPGIDASGSSFTQGATFIPGGFVLNWGYESNSSTGDVEVNLKKSFDNNFFAAMAGYRSAGFNSGFGETNGTITCVTARQSGTISKIKFNTNHGLSFFWFAIGN